jgi:ATP-dependent protease ClpP protease subunit
MCNENEKQQEKQGEMIMVSRRFYVDSEFNEKLANEFCEWCDDIIEFDELYAEAYPEKDLLPVVITISSRGGMVDCLNQMLDALDDMYCPIITEVRGYAFSCGCFLFARGDVRIAGNNSRIMYHELLYNADGCLQDHRESCYESENLMRSIDELIVSRTEIPQKVLDKVKREKRNWFLTRKECLDYKLINFDGRLSDVYEVMFADEEEDDKKALE